MLGKGFDFIRKVTDGKSSEAEPASAGGRGAAGATPAAAGAAASPAPAGPPMLVMTASGAEDISNISREELLRLTMKSTKRMRVQEEKLKAVAAAYEASVAQVQDLCALIQQYGGVPRVVFVSQDGDVVLDNLKAQWARRVEEEQSAALAQRKAKEGQISDLKAELSSLRTSSSQRIQQLQDQLDRIRGRMKPTAAVGEDPSSGSGNASTSDKALRAELEDLRSECQLQKKWAAEREAAWEAEISALRASNTELQTQAMSLSASKATADRQVSMLTQQLEELQSIHKTVVAEMDADKISSELSSNAQEERVVQLKLQLKTCQQQLAAANARLGELLPEYEKCKDAAASAAGLSAQVAQLQKELNDVALLNAEKRLIMDELRSQSLAMKHAVEQESAARIAQLTGDLGKAHARIAELEKAYSEALAAAAAAQQHATPAAAPLSPGHAGSIPSPPAHSRGRSGDSESTERLIIASLRRDNDVLQQQLAAAEQRLITMTANGLSADAAAEIEAIRADATAKSRRARQLLEEKDTQLAELRKMVQQLQADADSGKPMERKLFEFAAKQAEREQEMQMKNSMIASLRATNGELKEQLAAAKAKAHRAEQDLISMQASQAPAVNLEYLKNIVVRYLSFPSGSGERRSLVPVIAMLLHFTREEIALVGNAEQGGLFGGWLGAGAPIAVPPPLPAARVAATHSPLRQPLATPAPSPPQLVSAPAAAVAVATAAPATTAKPMASPPTSS